jgi:RES domain-containing protein
MLYTAQSRALALLEAVVHMGKMPGTRFCLATIDIPDGSMEVLPLSKLPEGWQNNPPPDYLKSIGDRFILSGRHLALSIPSVLMMEEHNLLLNPLHPAFRQVRVVEQRSLNMDDRLFPR